MGLRTLWMWLCGLAAFGLALAAGREKYASSLALLRERETEALRATASLGEQIQKAQATIADTQAKETAASRLRRELKDLECRFPEGSATLWLPALVREHFARSGISVRLIRLNTIQDEPDISGYERGVWSVVLPVEETGRNNPKWHLAVAQIESENPCLRVLDFATLPDPENSRGHLMSLTIAALVRK